ncbi:MAG: 23S rRNA (uracil(1939)-C(5))-methyltransferase RlmD, partial [Oscillospiraceae bacterium]
MLTKNTLYPIKIDSLSSDGSGVGRIDNLVVFVPCSAVGDELIVQIVRTEKTHAFAIIDSIVSASDDRIPIDCAMYKKCGGCCFRHISYEAELAAKKKIVEDAFLRIAHLDVRVEDTVPSPDVDRYRNKVQFPVGTDGTALFAGLFAPRSHRIISVDDCLLQSKLMNDVASDCCKLLCEQNVSAYDECSGTGILRHIFIRQSGESGHLALCLVINARGFQGEKLFTDKITALYPVIESLSLNINTAKSNVILSDRQRLIFGSDSLSDRLCGVPVRLSPLSFFQINNAAAELLYKKARELASLKSSDTLLDLYCGIGTIGLSMCEDCRRLIGVEVVSAAISDARRNAAAIGADNCEFLAMSSSSATNLLMSRGDTIDVVITDPPRKGCDDGTIDSLLAISPKKIVMISCNPATLARDVAKLFAGGYTMDSVYPFDLFPRTKHVECVVLMT